MNELDNLTKKLKESMTVLDVMVNDDQPQIESGTHNRLDDSPELPNRRRSPVNTGFG